jgi:hypothetical protein
MKLSVAKGCPQGGVLTPFLWDLVVEDLLVTLNSQGYYTQGYADNIVIVILGSTPILYLSSCKGLLI